MREPTKADEPTAYQCTQAVTADVTPPVVSYSTEHITSLHADRMWQAIWEAIKAWDINTPAYGGYCAANGDHVTQIYEAVKASDLHKSTT